MGRVVFLCNVAITFKSKSSFQLLENDATEGRMKGFIKLVLILSEIQTNLNNSSN